MQHPYPLAARAARSSRWLLTSYLLLLLALLPWATQAQAPAPSVSTILNPDGSLRQGASGSFNATGYQLGYGPGGQPRLTATGAGWNAMGGVAAGLQNGVNGIIYAVAVTGTDVYVAGEFTQAGGVVANKVARWNGTAWSSLGTGVVGAFNGPGAIVYALAVNGSDLYVGGFFSTAGGVAARNVARWNGTAWSALGTGAGVAASESVNALAVSGTDVYVGGFFSTAGGVAARNVARWNGTAWSSLGSGTSGEVHALAVSGSDVYVGGSFSTAGGTAANNVARWDGTAWNSLGTGAANGTSNIVYALAVSGTDVYVGGFFSTAGGVAARNVARWNGTAWSPLGTGAGGAASGSVYALAVSGTDLYAGGTFSTAGGVAAQYVARWDGAAWSPLGTSVAGPAGGSSAIAYALAVRGPDLYVGGRFAAAGGAEANYVARWNGTAWSPLGTGTANGVAGTTAYVNALAVNGSDVYVGGQFAVVGGVAAKNVARWDGTAWNPLGVGVGTGPYPVVYALAVRGTDLYVGGSFSTAGGTAANNVARWDGTAWSPLGSGAANGVSGIVYALAVSATDVYAGGSFGLAGGAAANRVARWNGTAWSPLGTGIGSTSSDVVRALAVSGANVYAGGDFAAAGGVAANNVARWDGTAWSSLGTGTAGMGGTAGTVSALVVNGTDLYAGGTFSTAGGVGTGGVARWNGTAWSGLGTGTDGPVIALAVSGSDVYAGGGFNGAGAVVANRVAHWDGTAWSSLGTGTANGVDGPVYALALRGSDVYAGGIFTVAGGIVANRVAYYGVLPTPVLASLTPASGPAGSTFAIAGTDLGGATAVTFTSGGGTATPAATTYTVASGSSITGIAVPTGLAPGTYTVTVTTPGGTSNGLAFTVSLSSLTISSTQTVPAGTYANITVTGPATGGAGVATLGGPVTVTGTMLVQAGGMLNTSCQVLSGGAGTSFVLAAGGTLSICDANGLAASGPSGAIQTATRSFAADATYLYNGTGAQTTGTGLPATVRELALSNAAGLTLSQPVQLTQRVLLSSGDLTLGGQALTLLSDATGTALVANLGGRVLGATATMQRHIETNPAANGYRHYASPMQGGTGAETLATLATAGYTPDFSGAAAYNSSATPGAVTPFPTVFLYNQDRIAGLASTYGTFDKGWQAALGSEVPQAGRGYAVQAPGAALVDFTGTFTSGTVSRANLQRASSDPATGWHLLGNPFPSPLDWSTMSVGAAATDNLQNMDGAVYVFQSSGPYAGSYRTYLAAAPGPESPLIPAGSGFFVHTTSTATPGTVRFADANRVTTFGAQPAFGRGTADGRPRLTLALRGAAGLDALTVYADPAATTGLDAAHDALKLPNPTGLNLAAQAGSNALAIDGLPAFGAGTVLPLRVGVPTAGTYALQVSELLNLPAGTTAVLVDTELNTRTELATLPAAGYVFSVTATQAAALLNGRFYLTLGATALATTAGRAAPSVQLFPNPATTGATLTGATPGTLVTVFDALGRPVVSAPADATGMATLALPAGLSAGVYVVRAGTRALRLTVE